MFKVPTVKKELTVATRSPERRAKIIESRVKSLERQIETFKKDLEKLDEHQ
jgi:chaperonin cofactor prefoldin